MNFDAETFKKQFPLFAQEENRDLIYLDNAATTQKPQCVIDAISHFYTHNNGNAQRSSHRLARQATAMIERTREQVATFLGTGSTQTIVFTRGATESANMLAYGLREKLNNQSCIAVSYAEHHANLLPWQQAATQNSCELLLLSPDLHELIDHSLTNKSITVLAITFASNTLGNKTDIEKLKQFKAHNPDTIIVADITQWLAHQTINLKSLPIDAAICSAHKFYGPTGIGILYGKTTLLERLAPLMLGGEMVHKVASSHSQYHKGYRGLEAGTSSMAAIAGLSACLSFWAEQDRESMQQYEQTLCETLHHKLAKLCQRYPSLNCLTTPTNNIGIASLSCLPPYNISDLALWLDEHNIAVRAGEHCAQLLWHYTQNQTAKGSLRISLAAYNTLADINQLIVLIENYCRLHSDKEQQDDSNLFSTMDWQALTEQRSWQQRYKQLIRWGKAIPTCTDIREEQYLINGCESATWLKHQKIDHKHYYIVDSDSAVVKGLAAIVLCRINQQTTATITAINFDHYFATLGLAKHLSASRQNGFAALFEAMMLNVQ